MRFFESQVKERAQRAQDVPPNVCEVLQVIKEFHDREIEPTATEVSQAVEMESRPLERLMSEAGVQARNVHRGGVKARRYVFELMEGWQHKLKI